MSHGLRNALDRLFNTTMPFQGGQPRRRVGLDLGSHAIKLVELEEGSGRGPRLVKSMVQELPVAEADRSVDRVGWLQSVLREFNVRDVHVSVDGSQVVLRRVHLPLMSKAELPEAVKWHMKDQIPYPLHDAVFDVRVIRETWEKDIKKQDVLVAVGAASIVKEIVMMVERAGAQVLSLTPTQCAAWRCATVLMPEINRGSVAVVEMGATKTVVTIAKDGHVCVVRTIEVGSLSITKALMGVVACEQGEVTIDHSRAEALKQRYGVLTETADGLTDEGVPLLYLASLMRPVLEHLAMELSRLFNFYKVEVDEAGISRMLLCGSGASLKQLQSFLADGLGVPVELLNPLLRVPEQVHPLEPEQVVEHGPRLAVAMGLALGHGEDLSLLPPDMRRTHAATGSHKLWRMAILALAALPFLWLQTAGLSLQQQLRRASATWIGLEPTYANYRTIIDARQTLEGRIDRMQQFLDGLDGQPVWSGLLKEVSRLVPATVELDELMVGMDERVEGAPMEVHITGRLLSSAGTEDDAGGDIAQFIEALEQSLFFAQMDLSSSETHALQNDVTTFTIDGRLE